MKYLLLNFFNTLRHYKASSLLNIIGMAVAFAAFYIILTQVRWGLGYNQDVKDADRIFLMTISTSDEGNEPDVFMCRPLMEQICSSATGVESYGIASFSKYNGDFLYLKDGDNVRKVKADAKQFSGSSLSTFGFEAEQGNLEDLSKPKSVAISSRFAQENNLKVGDRLSYVPTAEPASMEIVAIWKDKFQRNSCPGNIDMLTDLGNSSIDDWGEWSWALFVKLSSADGAAGFIQSASHTLRPLLVSHFGCPEEEADEMMEQIKISLVPFSEIYYRGDIAHIDAVTDTGNHTTDITLLAVAVLIIVIAMINFINFFFALVPARVRSVNTYKVFGTSRATLIANFIAESVGLVVLSMLLAAAIVVVFAKTSSIEMLSAPIDVESNASVLLLAVVVALAGAVLGSIYPALYITSFQPALVLKGSFSSSSAGRTLRNVLIGVQFTISIALIICATFVKLQHHYMMSYDMGFKRECLVSGYIPGSSCWWGKYNQAFEDKLRNNPDIVDFTWADGQIVKTSRMRWGRNYKGNQIDFQCYPVAYNFLDVMGIDIVEGRNFTKADEQAENGVMIFNVQARDQYGIQLDNQGPGHNSDNAEVAGFCKNFQFRPLQYGSMPFAFYMFGKDHTWRQGLHTIYVRIAAGANPGKVMDFIRNAVLEVDSDIDPDTIELHLFDEELARKYQIEAKLSQQITAFTLIAIILSLMGVFGLVFFETQHRKREIALRRVLGASVEDILTMFCRKYSLIVLICFVIASPLCWFVIDRYFSTFAYHTTISWWVFAVALVIVLAVTISIVVVRSISTAGSNPVDSIKTE